MENAKSSWNFSALPKSALLCLKYRQNAWDAGRSSFCNGIVTISYWGKRYIRNDTLIGCVISTLNSVKFNTSLSKNKIANFTLISTEALLAAFLKICPHLQQFININIDWRSSCNICNFSAHIASILPASPAKFCTRERRGFGQKLNDYFAWERPKIDLPNVKALHTNFAMTGGISLVFYGTSDS